VRGWFPRTRPVPAPHLFFPACIHSTHTYIYLHCVSPRLHHPSSTDTRTHSAYFATLLFLILPTIIHRPSPFIVPTHPAPLPTHVYGLQPKSKLFLVRLQHRVHCTAPAPTGLRPSVPLLLLLLLLLLSWFGMQIAHLLSPLAPASSLHSPSTSFSL